MEAGELARWTRFAAKGGIGKCIALEDCVAQDADDLMFLKGDEITVLLQLPEEGRFLGYCEGVVGRFDGSQVHFHGKLKKPVLTKRDSSRASMTRVAASSPGAQSPSPVPRHSSMRTSDASGLRVLVSSPSPSVPSPALKSLDNSPSISMPSSPLSNTGDDTVPVPFHLPGEPSEPNSPPAHMFGHGMENTHERMIQQIEAEMNATLGEPIPRYISGTPPPHSTEDEEEGPNTARGQPLPLLSSPSFSRSFADHSMDPSEPSMRISAALSDGETGIGLSLLNDLANGSDGSDYGDDDDDDDNTDYNSWSDKHHTNDSSRPPSVSRHDQSQPHSSPSSPDSTIEYAQPPSPLPAVPSIPVGGTRSRASSRGSEVWEGGSDIYDDYRYSRYSMASRMSFQIGGGGGGGGTRPGTPEEVPPVPRPKFGSGMSASVSVKSERAGEARGMMPPTSSAGEVPRLQKVPPSLSLSRPGSPAARQPVNEEGEEEEEQGAQEAQYINSTSRNRPPSLDLGNARSPLLRATFGSPEHSPALNSRSTFMSERSSSGTATTSYHSGSGHLISELRAHFEKEAGRDGASRDSVSSREPFSPTSRASIEFSGRAIVVEDEEGINIADTDGNTTVRDSVVSRNDDDEDDDDASVYSTQDTTMSSLLQTNAATAAAAVGANLASVSPLRITKTNSPMSPTFPPSSASPLNSPTSDVFPSSLTVPSLADHQHATLLPDSTDLERLPAAVPRPPRNPPPDAAAATAPVSGPNEFISRTSIFLPHPNAPKPTASPAGPMYSRAVGGQQQHQQHPVPPLPSAHSPSGAGSVLYTMRVAATPQFAPNGVRLRKTIYGKTVADLLSANGPVLMSFANTPFTDVPAVNMAVGMGAGAHANLNVGMGVGMGGSVGGGYVPKPASVPQPPPPSLSPGNVSAPAGLPLLLVPGRAGALPRTVGAVPQRHASESAASSQHHHQPNAMRPSPPGVVRAQTLPIPYSQLRAEPEQLPQPSSTTADAVVIPTTSSPPSTAGLSLPPDASPSPAVAVVVVEGERKTSLEGPAASTNNPLPRANFFPKAKAPRPRSRSFSGFNSTTPEIELTGKRSFEEGNRAKSPSIVTQGPIAHSSSASVIIPPVKTGKTSRRPSHAPSPLSLPQNNTLNLVSPGLKSPPIKPPSSPLARVTPFTADMEPSSESNASSLKAPQNLSSLRHAASTGNLGSPTSPPPGRVFSLVPPPRIAEKNEEEDDKENNSSEPVISSTHNHSPSGSSSLHSPKEPTAAQVNRVRRSPESSRANTMSPPPPKQPPSKPPSQRGSLLSKRSMPNLRGKGSISSFRDVSSHETVQVKDKDFELVRPTMPAAAMSGRSSEDSSIFGSDGQDSSYNSGHQNGAGTDIRPPTVASNLSASSMNSRSLKIDPQALTEAHRQREVRWMTLISREPAAQARKSKRVRKMLLEGVPSSVRYPVWAHLTDSKDKAMRGLYEKLQKRGRVAATPDIERDIRKLHMEQVHTQDAQGSLITLLQAYMNMVPDIQYKPALTFIAGHLLSLAPEEDAFWIFVCVMDTFMRPYFSQSSMQLEVDASLFSKSLEANDPTLARKIFVDLDIAPGKICRQWFPFIFSETLPADYLYRVWDIFLFEGVPFLMRIGMAILLNCRGQILEATGEQAVLLTLLHPPVSFLPAPERFIGQALALRFKDDDFRKLRIKMEAQVKRQTQARATNTATSSISLPRS